MRRWIPVLATGVLTLAPASVAADSFTPIVMQVTAPRVARLDRRLRVRVSVNADPGVLDVRNGALRAQVRLAPGECGGVFAYTPGPVLLDKALAPQPVPGKVYSGAATGSRKPRAYGKQLVCAFLDDTYEKFADNTVAPLVVNVSRACTRQADRYDRLRKHHARRAAVRAQRRRARRACGPGVTL